MNIYQVGQDYDKYKFIVFNDDDDSSKRTLEFKGQSLLDDWKSLNLFLSKGKRKDKRGEDFDASCYFSGRLFVNKRTSILLKEKFEEQIEILPVNVAGIDSDFYFINVRTVLDAINKNYSKDELLKMLRSDNVVFKKENIGSNIIFRDSMFYHSYYCTDEFVEFINQNEIKGLKFDFEGTAE